MDENIYSETTVSKFMNKNLFFGDPVLKKYYEQDELKKFRNRVNRVHSLYILNKVCRKYAEGMQCKSLTLSAYLVLQQVSLFKPNQNH